MEGRDSEKRKRGKNLMVTDNNVVIAGGRMGGEGYGGINGDCQRFDLEWVLAHSRYDVIITCFLNPR